MNNKESIMSKGAPDLYIYIKTIQKNLLAVVEKQLAEKSEIVKLLSQLNSGPHTSHRSPSRGGERSIIELIIYTSNSGCRLIIYD